MSYARLVVCESSPRWAVLIRRFQDASQRRRVHEARSLVLVEDLLRASPASFVAVAATPASAAMAITQLAQWSRVYQEATFAALIDEPDDDLAAALWEAGAQIVVTSPFDLPTLLRMAERHFDRVRPPQLDWRQALAARLPWQK